MLQVYCDGGSRGNPGNSAYGFAVFNDKNHLHSESGFLGTQTNNFAEYTALLKALEWLIENKFDKAQFNLDSQLVVNQMNGSYKVKNASIKTLYDQAKKKEAMLNEVKYTHILRHLNKVADTLVNMELDKHDW